MISQILVCWFLAQNWSNFASLLGNFTIHIAIFVGNGLESAIGYGHWICKTLQEIEAEDNPITASMPIPEMKPEDEYKIERQMNNSQKSKHNRYCVEKMFGVSVAVDCLER